MKFKVIATIIVILFLIVLTVIFKGGTPVDENGNPIPQEMIQQQQY